jgi:hypothetical protein
MDECKLYDEEKEIIPMKIHSDPWHWDKQV